MRCVAVKSEETQGAAAVLRIRELLIRQRTQAINALRGHLGAFGQVVPQGAANAARLVAIVADPDSGLPADAIATLKVPVAALAHLEAEIGTLDAEIFRRAKANEIARRLMTVPGIGPLIATAIAVLAPPPETFRKARDFAAWLGLTPRQHSTGGKQRLTKTQCRKKRRITQYCDAIVVGKQADDLTRIQPCHAGRCARPEPHQYRTIQCGQNDPKRRAGLQRWWKGHTERQHRDQGRAPFESGDDSFVERRALSIRQFTARQDGRQDDGGRVRGPALSFSARRNALRQRQDVLAQDHDKMVKDIRRDAFDDRQGCVPHQIRHARDVTQCGTQAQQGKAQAGGLGIGGEPIGQAILKAPEVSRDSVTLLSREVGVSRQGLRLCQDIARRGQHCRTGFASWAVDARKDQGRHRKPGGAKDRVKTIIGKHGKSSRKTGKSGAQGGARLNCRCVVGSGW